MAELLYSGGRPLTGTEKILYKDMHGRFQSLWEIHMDQTIWSLYNRAHELIADDVFCLKNEETGMPTLHLSAI